MIEICGDQHPPSPSSPPPPYTSVPKISLALLSTKLLLQKRFSQRSTKCYKIEFAINCTWHWRLHIISFLPSDVLIRIYLGCSMKQDRRLNKCLLMHITNWLWTILILLRLHANNLSVRHNYAKDIREIWVGVSRLAWCKMSPPPTGSLRLKVLRCLCTGH